MKDRAHDDAMAEVFRTDPGYAVERLNSIPEDGDQGELLIALRQMTKAFGGVAKQAQLNSTHLYRALSAKGNPEFAACRRFSKRWACASRCNRFIDPPGLKAGDSCGA